MQIHFILVQPRVPENIGAAARALDTMGFKSLKLVKPAQYDTERCRWVACKSYHMIEKAEICLSLEEALIDMDLVIGTTARSRRIQQAYHPPKKIYEMIESKESILKNVAILFGPEDSGLSNKILSSCDLVTSIPSDSEYGILNLAQALMVYAYELSFFNKHRLKNKRSSSSSLSVGALKEQVSQLLTKIEIQPADQRFAKIFEGFAKLNDEEIQLLHFVSKKLTSKINQTES